MGKKPFKNPLFPDGIPKNKRSPTRIISRTPNFVTAVQNHKTPCTVIPLPIKKLSYAAQDIPIKKRRYEEHASIGMKSKKRRNNDDFPSIGNKIPDSLKTRLQRDDASLVIKKYLTKTDVNDNNNRLAIPESQIINRDFLTQAEVLWLKGRDGKEVRHLKVKLIDQSGKGYDTKLARWIVGASVVYNLLSPWKNVAARNNLRQNTPIEVYSFRKKHKLYFAVIEDQVLGKRLL